MLAGIFDLKVADMVSVQAGTKLDPFVCSQTRFRSNNIMLEVVFSELLVALDRNRNSG